jgi:hypothetical protein
MLSLLYVLEGAEKEKEKINADIRGKEKAWDSRNRKRVETYIWKEKFIKG